MVVHLHADNTTKILSVLKLEQNLNIDHVITGGKYSMFRFFSFSTWYIELFV